ncbi:MAG: hypothetical protein HY308_05715 [Gammaproteobacteria bacterium]|nr:hypothetical protein [Gammaproteobacteria bacterium]
MKRYASAVFSVITLAAGFAAGVGTVLWREGAQSSRRADAAVTIPSAATANCNARPSSTSSLSSATATKSKVSAAELLERLTAALNTNAIDAATFLQLHRLAQTDPSVLRELMGRYESQPDKRSILKSLLAGVASPELVEFSLKLASSADTASRQKGFALLRNLPIENRVSDLVAAALQSEKDPAVLSQVVAALKRPGEVEPDQAQAVVTRLAELAQADDPTLRGESLRALAAWDRSGNLAEQRLYEALSDSAGEVRNAAFAAIHETSTSSSRLKSALLGIARNDNEPLETKAGALAALQRCSLSREEYTVYSRISADVVGRLER